MKTRRSKVMNGLLSVAVIGAIAIFATHTSSAQQGKGRGGFKGKGKAATQAKAAPQVPGGVISGVVRSPNGPEAGVWVVAETEETPTKFVKIVVTDDQGRFLLPDLPGANYRVFVRGYGLVDSKDVALKPGAENITLDARIAPDPVEAAQYYPGNYWMALIQPPTADMFPGTGEKGNGIGEGVFDQDNWFYRLKSNCNFCHQLGNYATRNLDHVFLAKPEIKTHEEAWEWRVGTGVRGNSMYGVFAQMGVTSMSHILADWTRAVKAGAVPPTPPRPAGVERNAVVTLWDVGDDHSFMHDQISTSKIDPTVNPNGRVYAVNAGHGELVVLDPEENNTFALTIPTRQAHEQVPSRFPRPNRPSFYWGDEWLWNGTDYNTADPHNPMLDTKGRVWMTTKIRGNQDPAYCNDGKQNKFADYFPLRSSGRQAGYYEPDSGDFTLIDTCFSTHHLQFDNDPDETVYFNELSGPMFGWIDSKVYDQTHDEKQAMGWCGQVIDSNGDGKITRPWNTVAPQRGGEDNLLNAGDTGGGQAPPRVTGGGAYDPKLDSIVRYSMYSVIPSPVDDSVWGIAESYPGMLVHLMRGSNPPETCHTNIFMVPKPGLDPRGVDITTDGVVWTALAGSSHLASFDVRKCKDLTGPQKVDGSQCPEGWTLYRTDGPTFPGTDVPTDFHYYNWVDQHNVMGFGANTPFATGSNSDSVLMLNPQTKEWKTFRVPYPMGYYSRGMDARIDDPNAGWKGRSLYSNYGTHFVWHIEGGKGTKGKIVRFQIRPNPLAR